MFYSLFGCCLILWCGLTLGVSFIATTLKFQAPNLSRPVAFEVGSVTFQYFNRIEWGMLLLSLLLLLLSKQQWKLWLPAALLVLIMALETFWLLPALYIRSQIIISGGTPEASSMHVCYILADSLKVLTTFIWGIWIQLQRTP